MSQFIPIGLEFVAFFLKVVVIVIAILVVLAALLKSKLQDTNLKVTDLNKKFKKYKQDLGLSVLTKKEKKKFIKQLEAKDNETKSTTFVLDFNGDIKASAVEQFRECVSAILMVADVKTDEVVVNVESPGGMVHGYGLAASQLKRFKDAGLKLIITVDKVAASGGYMMACLADELVVAPFAIIGSVGVIAQVPNFNKILKKNDIDYYQVTAGKFKRTLSFFGDVQDEHLEKFQEDLEKTHVLFKEHVSMYRPQVEIEKIATGEHWYGQQAINLKLVDQLGTSDDIILNKLKTRHLRKVEFKKKPTVKEMLFQSASSFISSTYSQLQHMFYTPKL